MTKHERHALDERTQAAIAEIKTLILEQYPDATFSIEPDHDDSEAIHLHATANVEDLTDLIEAAIERQTEMLVEDDIAIFVIPHRTPERNRAIEAAIRLGRAGVPATLDEHP